MTNAAGFAILSLMSRRMPLSAKEKWMGPVTRLAIVLSCLVLLVGCPKMDLPTEPDPVSGPRTGEPRQKTIKEGMSSLDVVKQIGFPQNGAGLGTFEDLKLDVWVYNNGETLLVFENGKLKSIVGEGGRRPNIRLGR